MQSFQQVKSKKKKGSLRKRVMNIEDLMIPTPFVTLVHPLGQDGSSDHAVCVVDDLVFDARVPHALKLKEELVHWVCGVQGLEKLGWVFRFSQPHGVKARDVEDRTMVQNW